MTVALAILARIWPYLLAAALALGSYLWADLRCWNRACHSQEARADKLQADADAAKKRATDLALLYARTITKSDEDTRHALAKQKADFAKLDEDAKHLSPLPSIVISDDAWRVLDDASDLANAATAPEVDNRSPAPISESALTERWAEAAAAYADARQKWASCVSTYEGLANVQIH